MVGRDVPAQVSASFLVAFVLDGPVLVEQGYQVAPVVGNEHIERGKLLYEILADAA